MATSVQNCTKAPSALANWRKFSYISPQNYSCHPCNHIRCEAPRQRSYWELSCDGQLGVKALTVVSLLKSKAAPTSHSRTHSIALARASSVITASSLSPPGKKGGKGWRKR